jgi:hypothetical protein
MEGEQRGEGTREREKTLEVVYKWNHLSKRFKGNILHSSSLFFALIKEIPLSKKPPNV